MTLEEKVSAVEQVFANLDQEIAQFQNWSGLHCKWGCGKCCFKSDIEATILEFLPFAHALHQAGEAFAWLEKLKQTSNSVCLILNPTQSGAGLCTEYRHRGLICRLFGFSARTNKHARKELVTCEIIKTEQSGNYIQAYEKAEREEEPVPVMHNYYMQLHAIDYELTKDFYPINEAICKAIETVLAWYAYRNT
ncbi:MAG: YkgJ family cysteine cluster protein [Cyclobacteriaceae bacterium]|nr:YkgJ family cysteine cluster protein [Cyclobacteriaceae bacterium]